MKSAAASPQFWIPTVLCRLCDSTNIANIQGHQFIKSVQTRTYHKTSNVSRALVGNEIVGHSDVVGASPDGAAPTTSSFST